MIISGVVKISELENLTKKELIDIIRHKNATIAMQTSRINQKNSMVRHFRIRLKKIRNSLDYLLLHPFSNDTGFTTSKHKRDEQNQKSKTK